MSTDEGVLALRPDGTLVHWGSWGESGGTDTAPVPVGGVKGVVSISRSAGAGWQILTQDGKVLVLGDTDRGQAGNITEPGNDGDTTETPITVEGIPRVVALAPSTVLDEQGQVWAWGCGTMRRVLGVTEGSSCAPPTKVPIDGKAVAISDSHAVLADGSVWSFSDGAKVPDLRNVKATFSVGEAYLWVNRDGSVQVQQAGRDRRVLLGVKDVTSLAWTYCGNYLATTSAGVTYGWGFEADCSRAAKYELGAGAKYDGTPQTISALKGAISVSGQVAVLAR